MNTNWKRIIHMYGRATDTPDYLEALTGNDRELIDAATSHLESAIVHQSTISMAAVPVLEALLEAMRSGWITDPYAVKQVFEWLIYLAESTGQVSAEEVPELDSVLLDQVEAFDSETDAETFLEKEGFELYEATFYWALYHVNALAAAVVAVLEAKPWVLVADVEIVTQKWRALM